MLGTADSESQKSTYRLGKVTGSRLDTICEKESRVTSHINTGLICVAKVACLLPVLVTNLKLCQVVQSSGKPHPIFVRLVRQTLSSSFATRGHSW